MEFAEQAVIVSVHWLRLIIETIGALVIAVGLMVVLVMIARGIASPAGLDFNSARLTFARYLTLALEFQLGADILSTAVAPTWDQIGKLGAIAIIRTALNYFLIHEMAEERRRVRSDTTTEPSA